MSDDSHSYDFTKDINKHFCMLMQSVEMLISVVDKLDSRVQRLEEIVAATKSIDFDATRTEVEKTPCSQ